MTKLSLEQKTRLRHWLKIFLIVVLVVVIANYFVEFHRDGFDNEQENTIILTGHGEVSATPDIANISFTISKDAKTVKEAQESVAQIEKKALDFLKTKNIADKDIKTTNVSFYPKYEYRQITAPCLQGSCPIPVGNSVIVGYTVSESISVKIRNTDDVGAIIEGLGSLGVTNLDGPNFAVDKEDSLKDSARKLAIDEAKTKAKKLAKDLGIRLGKITSFSENGNTPMPMYAKALSADSAGSAPAPAVLPTGENLITSDVTITYEIK